MAEINLVAEIGRVTGSRSSNRLRHEGRIPAVVYGHGMAPISVAVDRRALRQALTTSAGLNAVIDLDVDGTQHATVVKQLQRHPVRRNVTHVDFQVVNLNEEITVDVPFVLEGEATAVIEQDGLVDLVLNTLSLSTTPRNIPDSIIVDISELQPGDTIRISDLRLPAGVTTAVDPESPVVTTGFATVELPEDTAPAAEAEGGEGEGGEGEGGDAAAGDSPGDAPGS